MKFGNAVGDDMFGKVIALIYTITVTCIFVNFFIGGMMDMYATVHKDMVGQDQTLHVIDAVIDAGKKAFKRLRRLMIRNNRVGTTQNENTFNDL